MMRLLRRMELRGCGGIWCLWRKGVNITVNGMKRQLREMVKESLLPVVEPFMRDITKMTRRMEEVETSTQMVISMKETIKMICYTAKANSPTPTVTSTKATS